ncbi:hypothetical protein B0J14DRAFT_597107 [Halenospora varia]|nr:hypothetical protein B0J14DRAFT_597107 [Halenospora varia]
MPAAAHLSSCMAPHGLAIILLKKEVASFRVLFPAEGPAPAPPGSSCEVFQDQIQLYTCSAFRVTVESLNHIMCCFC